jgi:Scavenger receptor cysteine-rich domain
VGRLELRHRVGWGSACSLPDGVADVTCRQLGYESGAVVEPTFATNSTDPSGWPIVLLPQAASGVIRWHVAAACAGDEASLAACSGELVNEGESGLTACIYLGSGHDVGLACAGGDNSTGAYRHLRCLCLSLRMSG